MEKEISKVTLGKIRKDASRLRENTPESEADDAVTNFLTMQAIIQGTDLAGLQAQLAAMEAETVDGVREVERKQRMALLSADQRLVAVLNDAIVTGNVQEEMLLQALAEVSSLNSSEAGEKLFKTGKSKREHFPSQFTLWVPPTDNYGNPNEQNLLAVVSTRTIDGEPGRPDTYGPKLVPDSKEGTNLRHVSYQIFTIDDMPEDEPPEVEAEQEEEPE